ncbi:MAG TPA: cbb3-type cytochrome c oxidase subunit II [Chthoniobacterales bacterium]|nr:cbb3-type cytochrome c oxidase subunit II [Chthoniobacterales bacterium]
MKSITSLVLGIFVLFGLSWIGFVAYPYMSFAELKADRDSVTNELTPPGVPGVAQQGSHVFAANGCVYCHSQFARDKIEGGDIDRQWAKRRTVARDYMNDRQVFLGVSRLGPDLTNVGVRQKDVQWYYRLLYDPQTINPTSIMPSYRWLFREQKIAGQPANNALKLEGADQRKPGYEIVPTAEGESLVAYLLSLKHDYNLPEAPEPKE